MKKKAFLFLVALSAVLGCAHDPYQAIKKQKPDPFFSVKPATEEVAQAPVPTEVQTAPAHEEVDSSMETRYVCIVSEVQYEKINQKGWNECGDVLVEGYDISGKEVDRWELKKIAVEAASSECMNICPDDGYVTNLRISILTLNGDTWTLNVRYYAQKHTATAKDNPEDRGAVFKQLFRDVVGSVVTNNKTVFLDH